MMKVVKEKISIEELTKMARGMFGNLVKAVVDVEKGIIVVSGELHSDEEALLLEKGSRQQDLWGINIYPDIRGKNWIEFDSMINIRPSVGNETRGVDDAKTRKKIRKVVGKLIQK